MTMKERVQKMRSEMQKMNYPESVIDTAIGAIAFSKEKEATADQVETLIGENLSPKEMVKALQPLF